MRISHKYSNRESLKLKTKSDGCCLRNLNRIKKQRNKTP